MLQEGTSLLSESMMAQFTDVYMRNSSSLIYLRNHTPVLPAQKCE